MLSERKIDNGSCLKYHKDYYLPVDAHGHAIHHRKGTSAMVIKAFDNRNLFVWAPVLAPKHKGGILDNRNTAFRILGGGVRVLRLYVLWGGSSIVNTS